MVDVCCWRSMQPQAPIVWRSAPDRDGWWICTTRRKAQFVDLSLVRVERGQCFTEIGAPCGTPTTEEFNGARWLGPIEKP